jgi:2-methylcitrate dehydratase PrpD
MHGGFGTYKAKFEALLSAQYTAAAILHDKALTLAQFEPNRYDDQQLRRFAAERVEVRADASVSGSQADVQVETDGATYSARCEHPLGSYENPVSRAQIENKFATYAKGALPDGAIADVIGTVNRLEHLVSVRTLMAHLSGPPRAIAAE